MCVDIPHVPTYVLSLLEGGCGNCLDHVRLREFIALLDTKVHDVYIVNVASPNNKPLRFDLDRRGILFKNV